MKTIAFVVATKDRPDDLRKMLRSLSEQSHRADQIVIVDSSAYPVSAVTKEFPELNIKYIHHTPPSASAQRNIGIQSVDPNIELIGFLDDDVVLAKNALEKMLKFWQTAPNDLGGAAFNLLNPLPRSASRLKESTLTRWLRLYSDRKGAVMPSGWHTLSGIVTNTTFVEWLPSGASVWLREVFDRFSFDEFFEGYSYLEDLDFSYAVSKRYRLAIVADARYWHYPSPLGRVSQYRFGKIEVRNRLYIVLKHRLSLPRYYLGIIIRLFMTIGLAIMTRNMDYFRRALGNCIGVVQPIALQHIRTETVCISCGYSSPVCYFTKRNVHGDFHVLRCPSCSSAFVWPRPKGNEIEKYYESETYSEITYEQAVQQDLRYHPNSLTDSKQMIDRCSKLANGNRFLDVGAGHGRYSKTAMEMGFRVSACEPNSNAREIFMHMNGFKPDECMFEEEYAKANEEKFDVVLLNQVLEHVTDPEQVVRNIRTVLFNNGIAAIGVPHFGSALSRIQGKKDMYISPPEHLNFFSKRGLISLFARNNFKLEYFETVSKVNRGRIEDSIRIPLISNMVWRALYGTLEMFELIGYGMVINAYFRKSV